MGEEARRGLAMARTECRQCFAALGVRQATPVEPVQGLGHITGAARMSTAVATSVTDSHGRVWDHPNPWAGGRWPRSGVGTGNPTTAITVLALPPALAIVDDLAEATSQSGTCPR